MGVETTVKQTNSASQAIKQREVQERLIEGIRSGDFAPDSRLPSERDIAVRFGVSHMTARKAVCEMEASDLVERRGRLGTYVRRNSRNRLNAQVVHIISQADDSMLPRELRRIGTRMIQEAGLKPRSLIIAPNSVNEVVRILDNGEYAIVLLPFSPAGALVNPTLAPLIASMQRASGRAVAIADRLDQVGVPSVIADDRQCLRLAVEHLRKNGHRHIGLLCNDPEHPVARVQVAAWRSLCSEQMDGFNIAGWRESYLVSVKIHDFECLATKTYEIASDFLQSDRSQQITAMICLADDMLLPFLSACRQCSRPVPESLSLVAFGNNPLLVYAHPPVTGIDPNLEEHVRNALEILQSTRAGAFDPGDRLRLVEPRLIERNSVTAISHDA